MRSEFKHPNVLSMQLHLNYAAPPGKGWSLTTRSMGFPSNSTVVSSFLFLCQLAVRQTLISPQGPPLRVECQVLLDSDSKSVHIMVQGRFDAYLLLSNLPLLAYTTAMSFSVSDEWGKDNLISMQKNMGTVGELPAESWEE